MSEAGKIFVGNLSYRCTSDDLHDHFGKYGKINDAIVISDRESGRSRGFGFVTFDNEDDAAAAIEGMHETEILERSITVRQAESKRGGGGGGYGGGRRDNYGGGGGRQYGSGGGGFRSGGGRDKRDYNDGYQGGGRYGGNDGYRGSGGGGGGYNRGGGDRY